MLKWTGTNNVQVGVDKWFDAGFIFTSLSMEEVIGGRFATGKIRMHSSGSDEALKMITDQKDIDLTLGDANTGPSLNIHGVITKRDYFDTSVVLEFECIPDIDFSRRKTIMTYDDIDTAIKSLWKGKIENRTQTDLPSGIKFHQANEYDCEYLGTLCGSYKKDTIFALGLDGLLIKDLIGKDSTGHDEPYWIITGKGDTMTPSENGPGTEKYTLLYDRKLYMEPEDYTDISEYYDTRMFDDRYRLIGKDYTVLRENLMNNQKIYGSGMYNQQVLVKDDFFATTYRLGDVVKYLRPGADETKVPWEVYIISKIQYFISTEPSKDQQGQPPFRQVYTLHCLQEKEATMPGVGSDPMDA